MRFHRLAKTLSNPALGLDLLRIYLGVALLVRGAMFVSHPDALTNYMDQTGHWFMPLALAHYVVGAHIAGGILLALGLCTRMAAFAQAPILLGAVLFVHWGEGLLSADQSLELSALVLAMLVVIGVCGPGEFSVDHLLAKRGSLDVPATPSSPPPVEHEHEAPAHP
jgi:uncharacterized membrane protein YphA (DoxX/SURF4 family)